LEQVVAKKKPVVGSLDILLGVAGVAMAVVGRAFGAPDKHISDGLRDSVDSIKEGWKEISGK
jgi:hypothetical protein